MKKQSKTNKTIDDATIISMVADLIEYRDIENKLNQAKELNPIQKIIQIKVNHIFNNTDFVLRYYPGLTHERLMHEQGLIISDIEGLTVRAIMHHKNNHISSVAISAANKNKYINQAIDHVFRNVDDNFYKKILQDAKDIDVETSQVNCHKIKHPNFLRELIAEMQELEKIQAIDKNSTTAEIRIKVKPKLDKFKQWSNIDHHIRDAKERVFKN